MKEATNWLSSRNLPWKREFETICAPLAKAGKVTLRGFPKARATLFSNFTDRNAKAYILNTGKTLYVLMESDFDPKIGLRKYRKEMPMWTDDTMEVFIDPKHDHSEYYQYMVNPGNVHEAVHMKTYPGTVKSEKKAYAQPDKVNFTSEVKVAGSKWTTLFSIPFASFKAEFNPEATMGVSFLRYKAKVAEASRPVTQVVNTSHSPWAFNDLTFTKKPLEVKSIFLDRIQAGVENKLEVEVKSLLPKAANYQLCVETFYGKEDSFYFSSCASFVLKGKETKKIALDYVYNDKEWSRIRIRIRIKDEFGNTLYSGDHLAGYHNGLMVHYGKPRTPVANPARSDTEFTLKKIQYIRSVLPDFERKNTSEGYPSDYCIVSTDGKIVFNLMKKGVMQRIADYIYGKFNNDIDRLIGLNYLVHIPAFMTYAQTSSFVEDSYNPLSILRHNISMCGSSADVLQGLVEKLRMHNSKRCFTAVGLNMSCLNGEGHCIIVVNYKGKKIPLDPSIGRIIFNRDNSCLASIEEIVADPELVDRQINYYSHYYPSMENLSYGTYGKVVWPENAPAE